MPAAAGAQPLGERALRAQLQLELAAEVLAGELAVLADVGADRAADAAGCEQQPEPAAVDAAVVRHRLEAAGALLSSASIRLCGIPQRPKPPTASDAPSGMSATASAADAIRLVHSRSDFVLDGRSGSGTLRPCREPVRAPC